MEDGGSNWRAESVSSRVAPRWHHPLFAMTVIPGPAKRRTERVNKRVPLYSILRAKTILNRSNDPKIERSLKKYLAA